MEAVLSTTLQHGVILYAYLSPFVWMICMFVVLACRSAYDSAGSNSSPASDSLATLKQHRFSLSDVLAWRSLILWLLPLTLLCIAIVLNEFWRHDVRLFGYYPLGTNPVVALVLVHEAIASIWALSLV